jgi:hypothetical protein
MLKKYLDERYYAFGVALFYIFCLCVTYKTYGYAYYHDTLCFQKIAERYAGGDFATAINGSWSPMFSWLCALLLKIGVPSFTGLRLILVLAGLGILYEVEQLSKFFSYQSKVFVFLTQCFISLHLCCYIYLTLPDVLVTYFALLFFRIAYTSELYSFKKVALLGVFGALGYFAKSYFFYFSILYVVALLGQYVFFKKHTFFELGQRLIFYLTTLLLTCGWWIYALHEKYHHWTISVAGRFNHLHARAWITDAGAHFPDKIKLHPYNANGTDLWEDFSFEILKIPDWSPFDSIASFGKQLYILFLTSLRFFNMVQQVNYFAFLIIAATACYLILEKEKGLMKNIIFQLSFFCVLYSSGYCLLHLESRYLLPVELILIIIGIWYFQEYLWQLFSTPFAKISVLAILTFGLCFPYFFGFYKMIGENEYIHNSAKIPEIRPFITQKDVSVASDLNYLTTLRICQKLNLMYLGQTEWGYTDEKEIEADLEKYQIKYFFMYENLKTYPFLKDKKEITNHSIDGLRIFELR